MIQVYSLKLERELNERERQQALDILTPERKAKALRFRRLEDQSRGVAAGLLEAYSITAGLGLDRKGIHIGQGEQGKPYLLSEPDRHYNISHAGKQIVCGIGAVPIGIDVEMTSKYNERIIQRFFHQEEIEDIFSFPEELRPDVFAQYWTMKESFMKLCGLGFSLPLSSFRTNRRNGEVEILPVISKENREKLLAQNITNEKKPVCQFIELETGYQCCICTREWEEVKLQRITIESCLAYFTDNRMDS